MWGRSHQGYAPQTDVENQEEVPRSRKERIQLKFKKFRGSFATGWKVNWSLYDVSIIKTIKLVAPYFWPKNQVGLRIRVLICILILIIGRVVFTLYFTIYSNR